MHRFHRTRRPADAARQFHLSATRYAARLALVACFARWASSHDFQPPDVIEAEDMAAGIGLVSWFANEARRLYAVLGDDDHAQPKDNLLAIVAKHGGRIKPREWMRSSARYRKATQAEQALQDLVAASHRENPRRRWPFGLTLTLKLPQ